MIASSVKEPFGSPDWIFETKPDGYRAIAVIDATGKARLWSRNRLPLEPKFPTIAAAVDQLKLRSRFWTGKSSPWIKTAYPGFSFCYNGKSARPLRLSFICSICYGAMDVILPPRALFTGRNDWKRSSLSSTESKLVDMLRNVENIFFNWQRSEDSKES
jgi:hypothetical protein